jgi:high affinity sulfate transporter 1
VANATRDPVATYLPGVDLARSYEKRWLRPDLIAGLTVGAMLVPQAMAYANLAGLPAVSGLYAAVLPMFVYAVLGSSRQLMVGPESTTAIMTAAAVAPLAAGDPARYAVLAAAAAIIVGVLCFGAGLLRLGFLADVFSLPTLVGYLTGVGFLMIGGQLEELSGVAAEGDSFVRQAWSFLTNLDQIDWTTFVLGLGTLAFLIVLRVRVPRAPGALIAILVPTAIAVVLGLEGEGIILVGDIPSGFSGLSVPDLDPDVFVDLFPAAAAIAIIAYTDNILTARSFAAKGGYRVDDNQELIALGAVNVTSGLSQGFPVSSSGSRTAVGDGVGSRTQAAGAFAALVVIVILLFFRPVLENFPEAALAAIIIDAGLRLIDVAAFRRLARYRRSEAVLAVLTTVGVLTFGLLTGVVIAVVLSLLVALGRAATPNTAVLGTVPGVDGYHNVERHPSAETVPGLIIYRWDAPLFFLNATYFRRRARDLVTSADEPVHWVLIDAEAITDIDSTGIQSLSQLCDFMEDAEVTMAFSRLRSRERLRFGEAGLEGRIGSEHFFATTRTGVDAYLEERSGRDGTGGAG